MCYMKFRRRHHDPYSLTNLIEYMITTHVSLNAALTVSLGLARAFTVTTNYVLTLSFGFAKHEKMDSSSQTDGQVYVGF